VINIATELSAYIKRKERKLSDYCNRFRNNCNLKISNSDYFENMLSNGVIVDYYGNYRIYRYSRKSRTSYITDNISQLIMREEIESISLTEKILCPLYYKLLSREARRFGFGR
jgi:hypothetical protein